MIGLAQMIGLDGKRTAMQFAALHRKIDFTAALVASDNGEFRAHDFLQ